MEKESVPKTEVESGPETNSEDSDGEFTLNPFPRWREIKIANSSDVYVWVGIEQDRKLDKGGKECHIDLMQVFGAGFTTSEKDHHVVSRVPWKRVLFHRY